MATDGQQHRNVKGCTHHAPFVADLARPLIGMLDPKPGETILGCGDGVLAAMIHAVRTLGIDVRLMD